MLPLNDERRDPGGDQLSITFGLGIHHITTDTGVQPLIHLGPVESCVPGDIAEDLPRRDVLLKLVVGLKQLVHQHVLHVRRRRLAEMDQTMRIMRTPNLAPGAEIDPDRSSDLTDTPGYRRHLFRAHPAQLGLRQLALLDTVRRRVIVEIIGPIHDGEDVLFPFRVGLLV